MQNQPPELYKLIVSIILDETFARLSAVTKHTNNVFQTMKKLEHRHFTINKFHHTEFMYAYKKANDIWLTTQGQYCEAGLESSNVLMIKFLIKLNPWLIDEFDIKPKHLQLMYERYDLTKHILRTSNIVNKLTANIKIELSHIRYNLKL